MAIFSSSTQTVPTTAATPRHIAIIMDGNGRWAKKRLLPRIAGHKRGMDAVRDIVKHAATRGVDYLTLFAFSSENWRRPADEVSFLLGLFVEALKYEVSKLHDNGIRLIMIGDRSRFDAALREQIMAAEVLTAANTGLTLTIAVNYGGRWDVMQAMQRLLAEQGAQSADLDEQALASYLSMAYAPEPDLFIRTGGEQRISNFLLWQLAYTELYFTDTLWPDFNAAALDLAITSYQQRERRFGRTSDQLTSEVPS
ncbi:isoprenyl transferase [Methylobacillus flagellatus]|uniref:isoprenyl transferase n=1 Tax=Methylobacillus flagellatus TaxID=405 RepID=UPI0010F9B9C4|nr:isoprenyl transferase [Methylobacillus flagellatus]